MSTAQIHDEIIAPDKKKPAPRGVGHKKRFFDEPGFAITSIILAAAIALFIILPLAVVLIRSFGIGGEGLTFDYYRQFFSGYYLTAYWNSTVAALLSTSIVIVLSLTVSMQVSRYRGPLATSYRGLALLPLVAPPFVFSLSLIILFGRNGLVTGWINNTFGTEFSLYGFWGVVVAQVLGYFPVGYMLIENTMRSLNYNLELASKDLGQSQIRTLFRVTFPLSRVGVLKAALVVFVMALADFGNPLIIGGNTSFLASEIYLLVIGQFNLEMAAVGSVFLLVPSLLFFIIQTYGMRSQVTSITGSSGRERVALTGIPKAVIFTVNSVFVASIALLFMMVVLGAFVRIIGVNNAFTLDNFGDAQGQSAIINSVIVSFFAALIAGVIGMLQGFLLVRKPIPGKRAFEFLTMFGLAVPGTAMGIGYLILFSGEPFFWTGTLWLLVVNLAFRKIGVGMQAAISRMHQMDKSMEEASSDLGVGPYMTFFRIIVPLMTPSLIAGFVYAFMTTMVSVSSIIFLVSPGTELGATYILTVAQSGQVGLACAVSVVLIGIVVLCMGLLKVIERKFGVKV